MLPRRPTLALLVALLSLAGCGRRQPPALHFYAAASLTDAVNELVADWEAEGGAPAVVPVFASSSTLARQIREGAPAALFLSANEQWMDYLVRETQRVRSDSRLDLLSNRLVLVAPPGNPAGIQGPADLAHKLHGLALGDPYHVPAGIYAAAWLKQAGLWDKVRGELRPAKDVRAALAYVEKGEVDAGLVYFTDARVGNVEVLAVLDDSLAPPIRYPLALIEPAGGGELPPGAMSFYRWLRSEQAADVFRRHGFLPVAVRDGG
ncbi:MAG: molybdate ABC transporter substrate-binding protein [Candidatus Latescibacteria bacterium]|nr:molybdate ABC transporter substrate-binding protein [Candidatus Latescibacterota bacterium]